jgi:hypothetical protein
MKRLLWIFIIAIGLLSIKCSRNQPVPLPPAPTNLTIDVSGGSVNLSWDAVEEADAYRTFLSDNPGCSIEDTYLDMVGDLTSSYADREPTKAGYYHVRTLVETYYGDELSEPSNEVNTIALTPADTFTVFIWGAIGEHAGFGWDSLGNGKTFLCVETTKDSALMFLRDIPGGFHLFSADEPPFEGNRSVVFLDLGEAQADTLRIIPTQDLGYENIVKVIPDHVYGIFTDDNHYIKLSIYSMNQNSIAFQYAYQTFKDLPVF